MDATIALKLARKELVDLGWDPVDAEQFSRDTCIMLLNGVIARASKRISTLIVQ